MKPSNPTPETFADEKAKALRVSRGFGLIVKRNFGYERMSAFIR
jgi:hypothetical protein